MRVLSSHATAMLRALVGSNDTLGGRQASPIVRALHVGQDRPVEPTVRRRRLHALRPEDRQGEVPGVDRWVREQALVRLRWEAESILDAELLEKEADLAFTQHS